MTNWFFSPSSGEGRGWQVLWGQKTWGSGLAVPQCSGTVCSNRAPRNRVCEEEHISHAPSSERSLAGWRPHYQLCRCCRSAWICPFPAKGVPGGGESSPPPQRQQVELSAGLLSPSGAFFPPGPHSSQGNRFLNQQPHGLKMFAELES